MTESEAEPPTDPGAPEEPAAAEPTPYTGPPIIPHAERLKHERLQARSRAFQYELGERRKTERLTIDRLLFYFGEAFVRECADKARAIHDALPAEPVARARRPTVGAVFFETAKAAIGPVVWAEKVLPEEKNADRSAVVSPEPLDPTVAVVPPRLATVHKFREPGRGSRKLTHVGRGEARTAKVKIAGRPGPVTVHAEYVEFELRTIKPPEFPAGTPPAPATPTRYRVCVGRRHWNRVHAELANPAAVLVIDGFPFAEREMGGVLVYALDAKIVLPTPARKPQKTPGAGEARFAQVTVVGILGQKVEMPTHVILPLTNNKVPMFPRGMPLPPKKVTRYRLLMARKLWTPIEQAFVADPEDNLTAVGYAVYDVEMRGFIVHVLEARSAALEKAEREANAKAEAEAAEILAKARASGLLK